MDEKTIKKIYTKPKVMSMNSIGESIGKKCNGGSAARSGCTSGSAARNRCGAGSAPGRNCQSGSAASGGGGCRQGNFPRS